MNVDNTELVRSYFSKLGLEETIADIYMALYTTGPQTLAELSRHSGVERTAIYRMLDMLTDSHLIEVEARYKRKIYSAAPISNIRIRLAEQEAQLNDVREGLSELENVLASHMITTPTTRVQVYQGVEGIRQLLWNQTKAKTGHYSLMYEPINEYVGDAFLKRWADEINRNNIHEQLMYNDHFEKLNKQWYAKKQVPELIDSQNRKKLSTKLFTINHNMDIWDDCVTHYSWKNGNVYGFEIYDPDIANSQRQFFKILWDHSD